MAKKEKTPEIVKSEFNTILSLTPFKLKRIVSVFMSLMVMYQRYHNTKDLKIQGLGKFSVKKNKDKKIEVKLELDKIWSKYANHEKLSNEELIVLVRDLL